MIGKIIVGLIVIIALTMGVLACIAGNLTDHWINIIGLTARFFDVTLPVLGVAALFKYLLTCSHHGHHCHDHATEVKK